MEGIETRMTRMRKKKRMKMDEERENEMKKERERRREEERQTRRKRQAERDDAVVSCPGAASGGGERESPDRARAGRHAFLIETGCCFGQCACLFVWRVDGICFLCFLCFYCGCLS